MKIIFTFVDIGLKSNETTNKTIKFTKKSFFFKFRGFTQSHSGELRYIEGFFQLNQGTYRSNKPINITGIDKTHLKCDCIQGCIVDGTSEPILNSSALSSPPGRKIFTEPRIKLVKKINKSILSHITSYLEDDDHKVFWFQWGNDKLYLSTK